MLVIVSETCLSIAIFPWRNLAISVADIVAENKKPPENQEVLSLLE